MQEVLDGYERLLGAETAVLRYGRAWKRDELSADYVDTTGVADLRRGMSIVIQAGAQKVYTDAFDRGRREQPWAITQLVSAGLEKVFASAAARQSVEHVYARGEVWRRGTSASPWERVSDHLKDGQRATRDPLLVLDFLGAVAEARVATDASTALANHRVIDGATNLLDRADRYEARFAKEISGRTNRDWARRAPFRVWIDPQSRLRRVSVAPFPAEDEQSWMTLELIELGARLVPPACQHKSELGLMALDPDRHPRIFRAAVRVDSWLKGSHPILRRVGQALDILMAFQR